MKKNTILKIILGIISFFFGGVINIILFSPILKNFIKSETILDILSIAINILIAIQVYRLTIRFLIKKET